MVYITGINDDGILWDGEIKECKSAKETPHWDDESRSIDFGRSCGHHVAFGDTHNGVYYFISKDKLEAERFRDETLTEFCGFIGIPNFMKKIIGNYAMQYKGIVVYVD